MSRYKQLTKSKREFLTKLIKLDEKFNFLTAVEYKFFIECLVDKRYLTEDSEWINKVISKQKENYKKYKKELDID